MKRVVIIGAGPAGLTAAYELLQRASKEYEVIILEESGEIGGISKTVNYKGNRMDIGGHRFFSKDQAVMDWWQKMMPLQGEPAFDDKKLHREKHFVDGGPDPEKIDRVMLMRNRISRIYYGKKFFDYPISFKWETLKNMGFMTTMIAGFSYLKGRINKKEEISLEHFYINRFGRKLYTMFFEGYTEKLWGRHPSQISADWGAQRVKGLSITAVIKDMISKLLPHKKSQKVETSLIASFYYPKYGPGQLWETTASEIQKQGGIIQMHSCVKQIHTSIDGKITSLTYEQNGISHVIEGDIFISSMPLKDLVMGMDHVPSDITAIASGLPYRDFVTVGLLVNQLNLKNETTIQTLGNIVPDCWIYVQDVGVKLGRIQIFNNWSPYMVQDPEHTVWIGLEYFCEEGDAFWNMKDTDCIQMAIEELISMGVIQSAEDVQDAHREKIKKAYPAYFDTYAQIEQLTAFLDGFKNLYCVGRNGQHRYNNMDHSMATSFAAVDHILTGRTKKSEIWNINTEKSYHEEKNA